MGFKLSCITVCTEKNGHDANDCWFNAENKLNEAAKMKSDAEAILKSKKSNKKAYVAGVAAKESDASCRNCVVLSAPTRMPCCPHDFMLALPFSIKFLFLIPRPLF